MKNKWKHDAHLDEKNERPTVRCAQINTRVLASTRILLLENDGVHFPNALCDPLATN
jgi:hypothetical protein